jgi:O-antigen biosynthesis protein
MKSLADLYRHHQGKVSDKWSLYLQEYDQLFSPYRTRPINFLEIGIQNGGSLEIWSQYFPHARHLVGCDINPNCEHLFYEDPRINVVVGDINTDRSEQIVVACAGTFDLILDDGSHRSSDIIRTFARYFPHLNDGGKFVIEDLHCSYWQEFDGGLFDPTSSISFFKLLADIINRQHWGVRKTVSDVLAQIEERYDVQFEEKMLSHVNSVTFLNSMCVISKETPERATLGERVIAGKEGIVYPASDFVSGRLDWAPDQSANALALTHAELQREIHTLQEQNEVAKQEKRELQDFNNILQTENRNLQQTNDFLRRELARIIRSMSWRMTKPFRFVSRILRSK